MIYSTFHESLLPVFDIPDFWHADTVLAFFISDIVDNVDFGFARHKNFINFGENEWTDSLGLRNRTAPAFESVETYAFGIRYYDMLSVGLAIKSFDSQLARGYGPDGEGTAQGQVFDIGVRLEKNFTVGGLVDIQPALGLAIHSFPRDSIAYTNDGGKDPLPAKRWYGGSLTIDFLGLLGFTYANEKEYAVIGQETIDHEGYRINLTPFYSYIYGKMDDPSGSRYEKSTGQIVRFNFQEALSTVVLVTDFFDGHLAKQLADITDVFDQYNLKPNFLIEYAEAEIDEQHKNGSAARVGQTRKNTTIGFSIIGDFNNLSFKKNQRKSDGKDTDDSEKISIIQTQEDGPIFETVTETE